MPKGTLHRFLLLLSVSYKTAYVTLKLQETTKLAIMRQLRARGPRIMKVSKYETRLRAKQPNSDATSQTSNLQTLQHAAVLVAQVGLFNVFLS